MYVKIKLHGTKHNRLNRDGEDEAIIRNGETYIFEATSIDYVKFLAHHE
jgi:hypothetical protein